MNNGGMNMSILKKRVLPLLLAFALFMPYMISTDFQDAQAADYENIALHRPAYASLYQNIPSDIGSSAANSSWGEPGTTSGLPSYDETAMLLTDGIIDTDNQLANPQIQAIRGSTGAVISTPTVMIDGQSSSGSATQNWVLSESDPMILRFTLPKAEKVVSYSLLPSNGSFSVANAPHTWKLQASKTGGNDNSEWVDIDTFAAMPATITSRGLTNVPVPFNGMDRRYTDVSDITGIYSYSGHSQGNGGVQRYTTATDSYQYYRLAISRRNGGTAAGTISLGDIAFFTEGSTRNLLRAPFVSRWRSTANANQWVFVDLGEEVSYDSIKLHWGNSNYPTAYSVQVSNDVEYNYGNGGTSTNDGIVHPNTWTTIYTTTSGAGGIETIALPAAQTARYVKINMTQRVTGSTDYRLYEFEVFGTRSAAPYANPSRPAPAADGTQELTGGDWTLARAERMTVTGEDVSRATFDDKGWLPAKVPGTALMSYVKGGVVPDPNFDMNMMFISDTYFYSDWWYRTSFDIPADKAGQKTFLNFDGINWKAKVFVNGNAVSDKDFDIEGSFMRGKLDITAFANVGGKNYVAVHIYPPEHYSTARTKNYSAPGGNGGNLGADNPTFHANIHWDWIPTIRGRSTGIYDNVFVSYSGAIQLVDPWVVTEFTKLRTYGGTDLMSEITSSDDPAYDLSVAYTTLKTEVKNTTAAAVNATVSGVYKPGDIPFSKDVAIPAGETLEVEIPVEIKDPDIWWPNGYGDQPLYTAEVKVSVGGAVEDVNTFRFGARKLEFTFTGTAATYPQTGNYDSRNGGDTAVNVYCNGVRVYIRGGNWGMDDSNVDLSYEDYRVRIKLHAGENFTMIRNWVGMTMKEEFYDACDEYGLLIWDDFWLANPWDGQDPLDRDMFIRNTQDKIRVARKHPSLALYCARNESPVPRPLDTGIQDAIETLDGTRIYIRSSDASVWGISGHGDYSEQERKAFYNGASQSGVGSRQPGSTPQLHTERGQHVIANPEVLRKYFRPENLWPGFTSASTTAHPWRLNVVAANVWGVHDFFMGGNGPAANFLTQLTAYASMTDLSSYYNSLEDFSRISQLVNFDLHRAMFEAFTDIKSPGLLMWMSQSAWPSFAWRSYDYYYDTSSAYFGIKKACAPLSIIWNPTNSAPVTTITASSGSGRLYNPYPGGISIANNTGKVLTNLTAVANIYNINGTLAKSVTLLNGGAIDKLSVDEVLRINTEGNASLWPTGAASAIRFLKLELYDEDGELVADNFYWRSNSETGTTATGTAATNYYTSMRTMPVVSVDSIATPDGSDVNSNYYKVIVGNSSSDIALQVRIKATDPKTGDIILPVYYEDNYFCLLPGEQKSVTVDIEKLYFDGTPDFSISGFNVTESAVGLSTPVTMDRFTYAGETFNARPGILSYDVNVPRSVSNISFGVSNIVPSNPDDVTVSVALAPGSGSVPCVATVTIISKESPDLLRLTYTVNFGYITVTNLTAEYDSIRGWDARADIRFGDAATTFRLIYALYKDGKLVYTQQVLKDEVARHERGVLSSNIPNSEIEPYTGNITMKVFLWDQDYIPMAAEWSWLKPNLVATEVYKLVQNAADIKAGEEYVIVSAAAGSVNNALTNTSSAAGYLNGLSVTVNGDYISNVIADMVWETSVAPAGGLYFKNTSAVTYYGGGQEYLARRTSADGNPVALTTTIDDANAAYNRWSFSDVSAADSTVAMHTTASTASTFYILDPQASGFCVFYGTTNQAAAYAARPVKFYVKTIELRPA